MQTIKAIETKYKGYKFRSRLEARWAVYFDAMSFKWEYEHEGYQLPSGWYLPDFWLPEFCGGIFAEVKPVPLTELERQLAFELMDATKHPVLFCVGTPSDEAREIAYLDFEAVQPFIRLKVNRHADHLRAVIAARSARFEHGQIPIIPKKKIAEVREPDDLPPAKANLSLAELLKRHG